MSNQNHPTEVEQLDLEIEKEDKSADDRYAELASEYGFDEFESSFEKFDRSTKHGKSTNEWK